MSEGISSTFANAQLNILNGTAPTTYATVYFQIHTANPGSAGTTAISAGSTTRSAGTFAAASAGSISLTGTAPSWTNGGTSEIITDVSAWSAATSGTFLFSGLATLSPPTGVTISQTGSGGSFGATGQYFYVVTATTSAGETTASAEVYGSLMATTNSFNLSWTAVSGATGYKVYRGTTSGGENKLLTTIGSGSTVTYTDTGSAGTTATVPTANTAGKSWSSGDSIQLTSLSVALTPIAA